MKTIRYRSGYKYQLAEEYRVNVIVTAQRSEDGSQRSEEGEREAGIKTDFIDLDTVGMLTIKGGYAWDGPSGPTIDTKSFMRGSLVHDALYQLMRNGHLPGSCREAADQELHRICREDGMTRFRAWYVLLGVRKYASFSASPKSKKKIHSAP
jgi:hypothetical protein